MEKKHGQDWKDKNYSFFQHRKCEYFPCHPIGDENDFNCLFCYCPLYALGDHAAAISDTRPPCQGLQPPVCFRIVKGRTTGC